MSERETSGVLAALALSAAVALLLARWLPIEFEYVENTLGIVSLAWDSASDELAAATNNSRSRCRAATKTTPLSDNTGASGSRSSNHGSTDTSSAT